MIGKTLPSGYLASLRDARDALLAEGGRERDLRLIDAALRRFGAGSGDDAAPVTRQELRDARDALRALPGREADVALIDAALADGDH